MASGSDIPNEITHPETGAKMVRVPDQGSAAMEARLTKNVGNVEAGRQVLQNIRDKEQEFGYLYRDPVTGYQHRHKAGGASSASSAKRDDGSQSAQTRDQGGQGESRDDKRARLERELAELNAQ